MSIIVRCVHKDKEVTESVWERKLYVPCGFLRPDNYDIIESGGVTLFVLEQRNVSLCV